MQYASLDAPCCHLDPVGWLSTRPPAKGIRPTTPNSFSQNMMTRRLRDAQLRFKRTFCVISAELMRIQGGLSGYNRNGASVTSVAHYSCHVGCYGMTTCFFIEWRVMTFRVAQIPFVNYIILLIKSSNSRHVGRIPTDIKRPKITTAIIVARNFRFHLAT